MKTISLKNETTINENADHVWEILARNFLDISKWGSGITKSWEFETTNNKLNDAPVVGRHCEVIGFGIIEEKIVKYDSKTLEISWSALAEKIPPFVKNLQNNFKIEVKDDKTCIVHVHLNANLMGVMGFLMSPMISRKFAKTNSVLLSDLKSYAETKKVSARKQKELN